MTYFLESDHNYQLFSFLIRPMRRSLRCKQRSGVDQLPRVCASMGFQSASKITRWYQILVSYVRSWLAIFFRHHCSILFVVAQWYLMRFRLTDLAHHNGPMAVCQNLVPLVNIKIAGKWMFIPLKIVLIGIGPYPYIPIQSLQLQHIAVFLLPRLMHIFLRTWAYGRTLWPQFLVQWLKMLTMLSTWNLRNLRYHHFPDYFSWSLAMLMYPLAIKHGGNGYCR